MQKATVLSTDLFTYSPRPGEDYLIVKNGRWDTPTFYLRNEQGYYDQKTVQDGADSVLKCPRSAVETMV